MLGGICGLSLALVANSCSATPIAWADDPSSGGFISASFLEQATHHGFFSLERS
jgi:hypothetical protein